MRLRPTPLVILLLIALAWLFAVSRAGERPTLSEEEAVTSVSVDGSATSSVPEAEGAGVLTFDPEVPARALVTPTGIIVPVTGVAADHYEILTPCGLASDMVWGVPITEATVVLDPGHGGEFETGAVAASGLAEKEINLSVARRTARELTSRGISTVLTRTGDYRIPLAGRAAIANTLEAELLVSIHHNAPNWFDSDLPGTEVYVQSDSPESNRLGGLVWEEVFTALDENFDIAWVSNRQAGAMRVLNAEGEDSYGMIRRPEMPAVLAELAYMSNPAEAALMETDEYVDVVSVALADAIERWLTSDDPGSGFVEDNRTFSPDGSTGGSDNCTDPELG